MNIAFENYVSMLSDEELSLKLRMPAVLTVDKISALHRMFICGVRRGLSHTYHTGCHQIDVRP